VPHGVEEQDTFHVTPLLVLSLLTVAMSCAVAPGCTMTALGVIDTLMSGGGLMEPTLRPHMRNSQLPEALLSEFQSAVRDIWTAWRDSLLKLNEYLCSSPVRIAVADEAAGEHSQGE
jgi:hypothetical protein